MTNGAPTEKLRTDDQQILSLKILPHRYTPKHVKQQAPRSWVAQHQDSGLTRQQTTDFPRRAFPAPGGETRDPDWGP
jgi:hypothetical protein